MATISEVIKAYYLHQSLGMMHFLSNLYVDYSNQKKITQKMAKRILEGDHQERLKYEIKIPYASMFRIVSKSLMASKFLVKSYSDFEDLHKDVENTLLPIKGIGDLTVYDIAQRIGFIREDQILPHRIIYLNAGAHKGVNRLYKTDPSLFSLRPCDIDKNGEIKSGPHLMTIFKPPLADMPSMFLEDMLCIFDSIIGKYKLLPYSRFQRIGTHYHRCIHV